MQKSTAHRKRLRRIEVTPRVLTRLLTERNAWAIVEGVPANAEFVRWYIDDHTNPPTVNVVVRHPSFPEVSFGDMIPTLPVHVEDLQHVEAGKA